MGITHSPYISLQLLIHVKFIAYGYSNDQVNPFQWIHFKMNLPGDESYTPKLPWAMKVISDGNLASDVFIYVDYGHIIAHSELLCWQAANRVFSIFNSLVVRDASRKSMETSLPPGPMCGNSVTYLER